MNNLDLREHPFVLPIAAFRIVLSIGGFLVLVQIHSQWYLANSKLIDEYHSIHYSVVVLQVTPQLSLELVQNRAGNIIQLDFGLIGDLAQDVASNVVIATDLFRKKLENILIIYIYMYNYYMVVEEKNIYLALTRVCCFL